TMYPVSITGPRVALREFTHDDADAVLAIYGDPVVTEHLSFEPRNRDQVAATLESVITAAKQDNRTEYSLAAVSAEAGEVIGFALRADRWGQGLGAETVRLLLRLGFEQLGLHRLWGARSPDNAVSAQVMTKLGMIEEGRIRGHIRIRDTWRDSVVHSILRPEWDGTSTGR